MDKILGLSIKGYDTFYDTNCAKPNSCATVCRKLNGLLLAYFLNSDNVAIKFNLESQGHRYEIILTSFYLQYEEKNPLSKKMRTLINVL